MSRGASARSALARRAIAFIALCATCSVLLGCGGGGGGGDGAPAAMNPGPTMPGPTMPGPTMPVIPVDPIMETFDRGAPSVEQQTGGGGNDLFQIIGDTTGTAPALMLGVIDGAGGSDVVELGSGGVVAGVEFSAAAPTGGAVNLQNIQTITINGGTVVGHIDASAATTPVTFNLNSGTIGGDVIGSNFNDTFTVTPGDSLTLGSSRAVLSGLSLASATSAGSALSTSANIELLAIDLNGELNGRAGSDTFMLSGGQDLGLVRGGADNDRFFVTGEVMADLFGDGGEDEFTLMAPLTGRIEGGDNNDTITLNAGASVSGMISGGAGADTLILGGLNGGFLNIGFDIGFGATKFNLDTIETIRVEGGRVRSITASDDPLAVTMRGGTVTTDIKGGAGGDAFTLSGGRVRNVLGGAGADTFTLSGGTVTGNVLGGAGNDMFTWSGGAVGGYLDGGADTDTFTATAMVNVRVAESGTSGDVNLRNFETITLSDLGNTLALVSGTVGNILGGAGADAFTLSGGTVTGSIRGGGVVDSFLVTGAVAADLAGEGGADSFTIRGALTGSIAGGDNDDTITLNAGGRVSGTISGDSGADTLVLNTGLSVVDIGFGMSGNALNLQSIETIQVQGGRVTGGITASDNPLEVTMRGGTVGGGIAGGAGRDTFTLSGGAVSGSVQGGGEMDTFEVTGLVSADLAGDGGDDDFTIGATLTGSIAGGDNDDTITITLNANESVSGVISGDGGMDTLIIGAGGIVDDIRFSASDPNPPTPAQAGDVHLQTIETITINGGRVTGAIETSDATTAITFNLTSGTITGGVTGTSRADSFVIGAGITIGSTIDGGMGANTLSLASDFNIDSANLFGGVLTLTFSDGNLDLTLANIDVDIDGLTMLDILTFTATAGADTFAISNNIITGSSQERLLTTVIDGLGGIDELQLNAGAVVASVSFNAAPPTGGAVHLQNVETITLDGGTVNGAIDASAALTAITFNLVSGRIDGAISGSSANDTFIIAGALNIGGIIDGRGGNNELQLNTGAVVASVAFSNTPPTSGALHLQNIETITLNGGRQGRVTAIDASGAFNTPANTAGITFNLVSGRAGPTEATDTTVAITGSSRNDVFIIAGDITGSRPLAINGLIQAHGGDRDEVRLVAGGVVSSIDFGSFTAGNLSLRAVDRITLDGGTVNGDIDARNSNSGVTFNLISGTVGNITGSLRGGRIDLSSRAI